MKNIIVIGLLAIILLPAVGYPQNKADKKTHQSGSTGMKNNGKMPEWAKAHNYDAKAHAYFPDYYTYYDPARGGYVFWDNGRYTFSPALPPFLEKVDLNKTRIKILKGLTLDMHPEQNYPYYMKLYPAEHENNMVPVPTMGNPAH